MVTREKVRAVTRLCHRWSTEDRHDGAPLVPFASSKDFLFCEGKFRISFALMAVLIEPVLIILPQSCVLTTSNPWYYFFLFPEFWNFRRGSIFQRKKLLPRGGLVHGLLSRGQSFRGKNSIRKVGQLLWSGLFHFLKIPTTVIIHGYRGCSE